jgi:hypothetical protein
MPRRKSSIFKSPVLIQFQVTADTPGWFARFLRVVREMGDFGADVLVTLG